MIHKHCGGTVVEIEYACAVQLHCDKCRKVWQLFDSLDDIEEFPKGNKLIDSFPVGHFKSLGIPFARQVKSTWHTIGKKLRNLIEE